MFQTCPTSSWRWWGWKAPWRWVRSTPGWRALEDAWRSVPPWPSGQRSALESTDKVAIVACLSSFLLASLKNFVCFDHQVKNQQCFVCLKLNCPTETKYSDMNLSLPVSRTPGFLVPLKIAVTNIFTKFNCPVFFPLTEPVNPSRCRLMGNLGCRRPAQ